MGGEHRVGDGVVGVNRPPACSLFRHCAHVSEQELI